jgi:PadR family transcriptional regulator AphA
LSPGTKKEIPSTAVALLGLLTICPASGYDLQQFANKSISHFYWTPAKSQIYSELRRLTSLGFVSEELVTQEVRPDKRVYSITEEGRGVLTSHLQSEKLEREVIKSPAILRVFFGESMSNESLVDYIEKHRSESEQALELFGDMQSHEDAEPHSTFTRLAIRAGELNAEFRIKWSNEVLSALREQDGERN